MFTKNYVYKPRLCTENVLRERKLVLLVDLDQTLIHSSLCYNARMAVKGIQQVRRKGTCITFWLRLRPGTIKFLKNISSRYEMIVCTMGTANYAKTVVQVLDPSQEIFKGRIISREYFGKSNVKSGILNQIFYNGDQSLIHMIDDRSSVWQNNPSLIKVPCYKFFNSDGTVSPTAYLMDDDCYLEELEKHLKQIHKDFYSACEEEPAFSSEAKRDNDNVIDLERDIARMPNEEPEVSMFRRGWKWLSKMAQAEKSVTLTGEGTYRKICYL